VFNNKIQIALEKFFISLDYETTNSYSNSTFSAGTNPNNSVANYFLNYANGVPHEDSSYDNLDHNF
jgi:hypothetical protein